MDIIAISNQKGGVGKTTTAICLAQELQRRKKKVLFIDTDSQCNSTDFYEAKINGEATVADIVYGDYKAQDCIQHTEKGDIIASDKILSDAETRVRPDERRFTHLKRACKGLEELYDYIIIDTPPIIGVILKNVLAYADYIVIPVEESGWSLSGIMDFATAVELAQDNNEKLRIAGILTIKAKEKTNKSARINEQAQTLAGKLGTVLFNTKIRESVKCAEALTEYFVPLHIYEPKCHTTEDYEKFTTELVKRLKQLKQNK